MDTASYLLNRIPSRLLHYKTPYELLYQQPPYLSHLKVFGCLCYVINGPISDKFSPRAIPRVFMGYASTQKGYKVYDLQAKSFFISRNMVFIESVFPFLQAHCTGSPIFFVLELSSLNSTLSHSPRPSSSKEISPSLPTAAPTKEVPTGMPPASSFGMSSPDVPNNSALIPLPTLVVPQRKSTRVTNPLVWLTDFVTSKSTFVSSIH